MKRFLLIMIFLLSLTIVPCNAAELTEKENNNTLKKAEEFAVGDVMIAQLSKSKDVDCFKFQVPFDGTIHFTFVPFDQSDAVYSYSWVLTVYGPDKKTELLSGSLPSNKSLQFDVENVEAGMHYLKFEKVTGGNPLINGYSKQQFSISAQMICKEHGSLKEWEIVTAPTCQNAGEKVQRCSVCNWIVGTESLDKLDHSYTEWTITQEATITKDGKRERTCTYCNDVLSDTYTHPMASLLAFGFVGLIILVIVVIFIIRKKCSDSSNSSTYSSSYSSGGGYSSNYNSGGNYYSNTPNYDSSSFNDDPCNYGNASDYNPLTNTYTNADGVTQTLEKGYVVDESGTIHIDVSDM